MRGKPTIRAIATAVRLPHTEATARLRAELLISLFDLPPLEEPFAPIKQTQVRRLSPQETKVLLALKVGIPVDDYKLYTKSWATFRSIITHIRKKGYSVTCKNGFYYLGEEHV